MLAASFVVPSKGSVIDASWTSRADIVSSVMVKAASAWVARGDVLINATGLFKLKAADQPVQRVLHDAGDAAGIFRARDQKSVGGSDDSPEFGDLPGKAIAIEVGIEERRFPIPSKISMVTPAGARRLAACSTAVFSEVARRLPEIARIFIDGPGRAIASMRLVPVVGGAGVDMQRH